MKFTLDANSRVNLIRSYGEGELRVGDDILHTSCIVTADTLIKEWPPQTLDELQPEYLQTIFDVQPEVVVLGTGATQRFPSAQITAMFGERRIGLEVMTLGAACRTFNILVQEDRRVAAVLFLR